METTSTTEQWWYELNGQQIGPITKEEIQSLINEGKLNTESLVWTSGLSEWIKLKNSPLNPIQETDNKPWWYNLNGQQIGPVSNEEIHLLIKAGKLNAESFVWKQGMSNWMPLKHTELAAFIEHVTKDITDQMQNIKKKGCLIGVALLLAFFFFIALLPDSITNPMPSSVNNTAWWDGEIEPMKRYRFGPFNGYPENYFEEEITGRKVSNNYYASPLKREGTYKVEGEFV